MNEKLPIIGRLEAERDRLRKELSVDLPKIIEEAREHGDLKENAEYHAAKERQGMVSARVGHIEERLRQLSIYNISSIPSDRIGYGSEVEFEDCDTGKTVNYALVFPEEVDATKGLVSISSPIGQAMLNRSEGDEIRVQTPGGLRTLEVLSIKTIHEVLRR